LHWAVNPTTFMCRFSCNLGALSSWNPMGLSRPVMGSFYLLPLHITYYIPHSRIRCLKSPVPLYIILKDTSYLKLLYSKNVSESSLISCISPAYLYKAKVKFLLSQQIFLSSASITENAFLCHTSTQIFTLLVKWKAISL
jgi:hypothetical protein